MRTFGQVFGLTRYGALAAVFLVVLLGVGAVAAVNYLFVERTATSMAAVGAIGREQLQPRLIAAGTQLLKSDLDSRRYLGRGLAELQAPVAAMDAALTKFDRLAIAPASTLPLLGFAPLDGANNRRSLQEIKQLWTDYRQLLQPVVAFKAEAYIETADQGTQLSPAGLQLNRQLNEATRFGLTHHEQMARLIGKLAAGIERDARAQTEHLRIALLAGAGITALLLLFILFFLGSVSRKERAASRAKKETDDILRTVNQGLFLLDEQLKLGSERSEALERIFRRQDFDKLSFENLLYGIVPDKTRETAAEYVKLLWGERVNEKLIKTINPLSEVEVHFDTGSGGIDTQYLEFDFNRVRADGRMSRILVTVNDVTRRVQLARELQESQEKAQAQLDMLLHVLHVEPQLLAAFLEESEVSLKMVNSILKEPAREEMAFRAKLDGIFRQVHSIKGEAAGLGLKTIEQRAHAFEEALSEMRSRPTLGGNDFLPLVVKLDDLFGHLSQVREMLGRLADLRTAMSGDATPTLPHNDGRTTGPEGTLIQPAPAMLDCMLGKPDAGSLETTLASLAKRIAGEQSKQVELACTGLEQVPNNYRRAIKDIAIQMVRNSLTHGIETPEERARSGKEAAGKILVRFEDHDTGGFEFVYQDDGRGLTAGQIKQTAISRGIVTAEQAAKLDDRRALSLIFLAGFSTQDQVTKDAGRGVGMDIVRNCVQELGGKLGISTAAGKYLRFRIWLPASSAAQAAA